MSGPELLAQPCWPNSQQRLLLIAALASENKALHAWRAWEPAVSLQSMDFASYRLLPMVYHNLKKFQDIDTDLACLKSVVDHTGERNERFFEAALMVTGQLSRAGINALFMKGAPLAIKYYLNLSLRPMGDIDLLVPFDAAHNAIGILRQLGFKTRYHISPENIALRHSFDFIDESGIGIDLHWYVLEDCCSPQAQQTFWNDSETMHYHGRELNCLSTTDSLFQVVVHGSRWDIMLPTNWVLDAHVLLDSGKVNWRRLVELAVVNRLILQVRFALEFYNVILPGKIPQWVVEDLAAAKVSGAEKKEYYLLSTPTNYFKRLGVHWYRYRRFIANTGNKKISFLDYVKRRWGIDKYWQIPWFVLSELYTRRKSGFVGTKYSLKELSGNDA